MNLDFLRYDTIGYGTYMDGPYGKRLVTYADYTASGKPIGFLENYYLKLGETYANTHTEVDYTGRITTKLYQEAKDKIRQHVGANKNYCVLPIGTGATAAIEKLTKILGIYKTPEYWRQRKDFFAHYSFDLQSKNAITKYEAAFQAMRPVVFISSYEHHSNEIQWREGHAEVIKIGLNDEGLFDLEALKRKISDPKYKNRMKIGSFSAASNVTGVKSPVYEIAQIMHENGGYVFFDFAASAPYVEINMTKDSLIYFDGIYLSMHKFIGGTSASGILVLNKAVYKNGNAPCSTGGGTVKYVTNQDHRYLNNIEERETAGTPGIMQVIRAAMAFDLKETIGVPNIEKMEQSFITEALSRLTKNKNIEILGNLSPINRVGILSFNVRHKEGYLHHKFVSALLNDLFGIQCRAGCACAGPYGICLLNIDDQQVEGFKEALDADVNILKPGWVRVNFHYTLDQETFDYILSAINFVANYGHLFLAEYNLQCVKGSWQHRDFSLPENEELSLLDALLLQRKKLKLKRKNFKKQYQKYLDFAHKKSEALSQNHEKAVLFGTDYNPVLAWFYHQPAPL